MEITPFSPRFRLFIILFSLQCLAASSLACTIQRDLFRFIFNPSNKVFQKRQEEIFSEQYDATIVADDLVAGDNSESVLEEDQRYGSVEDSPSNEEPEPAHIPDPVSEECEEAGLCVAAYPVDIRSTANPPDVKVFANAAEHPSPAGFSVTYTESAGPWYEWIVLFEPGDFIQASSPAGYSALGIQFWGDKTNGWARVTLDGVEVWRGDITAFGTDGYNYFVYVEVTGIDPGPHTLRAEVLGQPGTGGGDNVPAFYFAYRE